MKTRDSCQSDLQFSACVIAEQLQFVHENEERRICFDACSQCSTALCSDAVVATKVEQRHTTIFRQTPSECFRSVNANLVVVAQDERANKSISLEQHIIGETMPLHTVKDSAMSFTL